MTRTLGGLTGHEDGLFYLLPPEMARKFSAAGLSQTAVARFLLHNIRPRVAGRHRTVHRLPGPADW
jgi:hypothetical protein